MIDGVDMPPPARGCLSTEGTGRGSTKSIMTFIIGVILIKTKKGGQNDHLNYLIGNMLVFKFC
jgi:hypothetical protein